jgi:hypothetical protein
MKGGIVLARGKTSSNLTLFQVASCRDGYMAFPRGERINDVVLITRPSSRPRGAQLLQAFVQCLGGFEQRHQPRDL